MGFLGAIGRACNNWVSPGQNVERGEYKTLAFKIATYVLTGVVPALLVKLASTCLGGRKVAHVSKNSEVVQERAERVGKSSPHTPRVASSAQEWAAAGNLVRGLKDTLQKGSQYIEEMSASLRDVERRGLMSSELAKEVGMIHMAKLHFNELMGELDHLANGGDLSLEQKEFLKKQPDLLPSFTRSLEKPLSPDVMKEAARATGVEPKQIETFRKNLASKGREILSFLETFHRGKPLESVNEQRPIQRVAPKAMREASKPLTPQQQWELQWAGKNLYQALTVAMNTAGGLRSLAKQKREASRVLVGLHVALRELGAGRGLSAKISVTNDRGESEEIPIKEFFKTILELNQFPKVADLGKLDASEKRFCQENLSEIFTWIKELKDRGNLN